MEQHIFAGGIKFAHVQFCALSKLPHCETSVCLLLLIRWLGGTEIVRHIHSGTVCCFKFEHVKLCALSITECKPLANLHLLIRWLGGTKIVWHIHSGTVCCLKFVKFCALSISECKPMANFCLLTWWLGGTEMTRHKYVGTVGSFNLRMQNFTHISFLKLTQLSGSARGEQEF